MQPIEPDGRVPQEDKPLGQQNSATENAQLLSALLRGMPQGKELQPHTLRQLLNDPAQLSALVRRAGLEKAVARSEVPADQALQNSLARVAPHNLSRLIAVLEQREQPAINLDSNYGEPAVMQDRSAPRRDTAYQRAAPPRSEREAVTIDVMPSTAASDDYRQEDEVWEHEFSMPPPDWPKAGRILSPALLPSLIMLLPIVVVIIGFVLFRV